MKTTTIQYKAVKFNKADTQYISTNAIPEEHWLTERVKIEAFQGYSRAYNLAEYFRTRGATSWKSGLCVTGLWKSQYLGAYYGDIKTDEGRSLILFYRSHDHEKLNVVTFEGNYYPSKNTISQLIFKHK